ncbi:MAG: ATP-binding protein [Candidatus Njordarchaeales archaeon]
MTYALSQILNITPEKPAFWILYGKRGVGKTTLLCQIAKELSSNICIYLSLIRQRRDLKTILRLLSKKKRDLKIHLTRIEVFLEERIELLRIIIQNKNKNCILLIDEILPPTVLAGTEWERSITKKLGVYLTLLLYLLGKGWFIFATVPEDPYKKLPRRWQVFIEFSTRFLRLARRNRLRYLYEVRLEKIPEEGVSWDPDKIKMSEKIVGKFLLTGEGLSLVQEDELWSCPKKEPGDMV